MGDLRGQPVRLGVIGLGPCWRERYRPAALAARSRFVVRSVYDQVRHNAAREARRLNCEPAESITALIGANDIDALLLADEQWFRLWPLRQAMQAGKPVLCLPAQGDFDADLLGNEETASGSPVVFALRPRLCPAARRLGKLLRKRLGTPWLVLIEVRSPRPWNGIEWLDWCGLLMDAEPKQARRQRHPGPDRCGVESYALQYDGNRSALVNLIRLPDENGRETVRAYVVAERGEAVAILPRRLHWRYGGRHYRELLPDRGSLERRILRQFLLFLNGEESRLASASDVLRTAQVFETAMRSAHVAP